jgi:VanZ family protein
MAVIFIFSSLPINQVRQFSWTDFILKKTAHVIEYAILFFLIWRAGSNEGRRVSVRVFLGSLILSLLYALTDEWHQTLTPGREGTLRDVGFDGLGILLSFTWLKGRT